MISKEAEAEIRAALPRREVADRHDRRAARDPSHHRAARAAPRRGRARRSSRRARRWWILSCRSSSSSSESIPGSVRADCSSCSRSAAIRAGLTTSVASSVASGPRKPAEAFQRLRTLPGEQAQVDWAHFGKLQVGRAERPLWAFVMVLSYSRRIFLRFFPGASDAVLHARARRRRSPRSAGCLACALRQPQERRPRAARRRDPVSSDAPRAVGALPLRAPSGGRRSRQREGPRRARDSVHPRGLLRGPHVSRPRRPQSAGADWTHDPRSSAAGSKTASRTVREAFEEERGAAPELPDEPFPAHERVEVEIGKTPYARFDLNDYSVPHDRTQRTLVVLRRPRVRAPHGRQRGRRLPRSLVGSRPADRAPRAPSAPRRREAPRSRASRPRPPRQSGPFSSAGVLRRRRRAGAATSATRPRDCSSSSTKSAPPNSKRRSSRPSSTTPPRRRRAADRRPPRSQRGLPPPVSIPVPAASTPTRRHAARARHLRRAQEGEVDHDPHAQSPELKSRLKALGLFGLIACWDEHRRQALAPRGPRHRGARAAEAQPGATPPKLPRRTTSSPWPTSTGAGPRRSTARPSTSSSPSASSRHGHNVVLVGPERRRQDDDPQERRPSGRRARPHRALRHRQRHARGPRRQDSSARPGAPPSPLHHARTSSASTRSATSPTTTATPTCSSRSSRAATTRRSPSPAQHQQGLRRVGRGLPQRGLRRHPRRPPHPPRRDHRDRGRQLPPQGGQGAQRRAHQAAPRQEALSPLTSALADFTGEDTASAAESPLFTGELHRIPAWKDRKQA
jgi:hypothetical protein